MKELLHTFIYEVKYKQAKRIYLHTPGRKENLEIAVQCSAVHCRGESIRDNLARLQQLQFLLY